MGTGKRLRKFKDKGDKNMEKVNIIGYFKEDGSKSEQEELHYFVAFENSNSMGGTWIEGYNVLDGHFQLKDASYLSECKEITKDEYVKATSKYRTPKEYL